MKNSGNLKPKKYRKIYVAEKLWFWKQGKKNINIRDCRGKSYFFNSFDVCNVPLELRDCGHNWWLEKCLESDENKNGELRRYWTNGRDKFYCSDFYAKPKNVAKVILENLLN